MSVTTTLDDEVRLLEAEWWMSQPHEVFERMRREQPLFWSERDRIWAVTKYDDVRWISKSPQLFANRYHVYAGFGGIEDDGAPSTDPLGLPRRTELRGISALGPMQVDSIVMADGERHTFLRKIASKAFTPKVINQLEAQVRDISSERFDQIPEGVEVDFIDTVAAPVPMIMIALMLGVPVELLDSFRRWSDAFIEMQDESMQGSPEEADRITAIIEFREYFAEQLRARLDDPKDDLLTAIAHAEWQGAPMSEEEQLSMTQILLIAGNETTRGLLAGAGKAMAEFPDQRALLAANPDLMANAVEEFLRYVSPVTHMCRTALEEVELRGRTVAPGDFLVLVYPSANRDEDVWERADQLDVTRKPDPSHVAFGFAEHFCLGSNLARREARIVLGELLARFPNYELVGDTPRVRQHMTPGIKQMPVIFRR